MLSSSSPSSSFCTDESSSSASPLSFFIATLAFFLSLALSFFIFFFSETVFLIFCASSISPRYTFFPFIAWQNSCSCSGSCSASFTGTILKFFFIDQVSTFSSCVIMKQESCFSSALPTFLYCSSLPTNFCFSDSSVCSCNFRIVFWICRVRSFLRTCTTFFCRVATVLPPFFFCFCGWANPFGAPRGTGMKNFVIVIWIYNSRTVKGYICAGKDYIQFEMSFFKNCKSLSLSGKWKSEIKISKNVENKCILEEKAEKIGEITAIKEEKVDEVSKVEEVKIIEQKVQESDVKEAIMNEMDTLPKIIQEKVAMVLEPEGEQMVEEDSAIDEEEEPFTLSPEELQQRMIETLKELQSLRNGSTSSFIRLTNNLKVYHSITSNTPLPPPLFPACRKQL